MGARVGVLLIVGLCAGSCPGVLPAQVTQRFLVCLARWETGRPLFTEKGLVRPGHPGEARMQALDRLDRVAAQLTLGPRDPAHLLALDPFVRVAETPRVQSRLWLSETLVMDLAPGEVDRVARHPEVDWVYPDRFLAVTLGRLDGEEDRQPADWSRRRPELLDMRDRLGLTGRGVRIAVLDTGLDPRIRLGSRLKAYRDFSSRPSPVTADPDGHGSRVIDLLAGEGGVAPEVDLVVGRVVEEVDLGGNAGGRRARVGAFASRILQSLQWVADQQVASGSRIHVLNGSWGFPEDVDLPPGIFRDALSRIRDLGTIPVFAAGNGYGENPEHVQIPASYPEVLAVGASTGAGERARFSATGSPANEGVLKPDLVAPGTSIPARDAEGSPLRLRGTSFACVLVAGGIALLREALPEAGAEPIVEALRRTASDMAAPGPDLETGWGEIRMGSALQWLGGPGEPAGPEVLAARSLSE